MATSFLYYLTLLLLISLPLAKPDLNSDKAALLALQSTFRLRSFNWSSTTSPCTWQAVECENGRVTVLHLPGVSLTGQFPSGILGNLTHLRTLSIRLNALTGDLPSDLQLCSDLRNLYAQGNNFSGEIPGFLFGMGNLVRLNLAGNSFSGGISKDFNKLTRLRTLYLEENRLTGAIPDLDFDDLQQFNVSFNRLNGAIPSKLGSTMKSGAFLGNSLHGCPLDSCPTAKKKKKKNTLSGGAIAGIIVGSVIGFLLLLLILFFLCRKKSSSKSRSVDIAPAKNPLEVGVVEKGSVNNANVNALGGGAAKAKAELMNGGKNKLVFFNNATSFFELDDLLKASAEVLGNGTYGTAYKAVLEYNYIVSVKRLKDVAIPEQEFRDKIEIVGSMDHKNILQLRAYYYSGDEKLLVCDYMHMGSLSALLHGNKGASRTPLNWETRSRIALGAARGIEYLQLQGPSISHGSIKSSNILLTDTYDARVSDFCLAHLVGPSSTPNRVTGYRAPEVTDARKVSQKADVYSFGVLLLELLTGKSPSQEQSNNEEGVDLPRWVQSVVREEWTSEVFDLELLRYQNVEEDMVQLLQLAVDCVAQYPDKRPSMPEVVRRIEELCHSEHDTA